MCGIGGIAGDHFPGASAALDTMLRHLEHRGPDDRGIHLDEQSAIGLCATRLAIRDVSSRGHQPMEGPSGCTIAFNGELYNSDALRRDLERVGRVFRGGSDTEVALAAFEEWGPAAWRRLRGMFAVAIADPRDGALWLVRDPLGIKPLYLLHERSGLAFASELRALLAGLKRRPRLDQAALASFFATGAVEEPLTMAREVRMLPAGTAARFRDGALELDCFWAVGAAFSTEAPIERDEAVRALRAALEAAVASQLVSDVPLGVFLSGGIDSSALVGLAATVDRPPETVSIVFAEEQFSEAPYIEAVRRRYGTRHHEIVLTGDDFLRRLPAALQAMDQPTFDGVNTFVVSEVARGAGLTVALSGMGGDELFGGYELFRTIPKLERLRRLAPRLPRAVAAFAGRAAYGRGDRGRKFGNWLAGNVASAYTLQRELLDQATRERLIGAPDNAPAGGAAASDPNAISCLELARYMRNVLLRDADVMSMAHSLEVRVPLLDQALVELVGRIPSRYKLAPRREKPLLLDAVADLLPESIKRREKMGFTLPFEAWLRGPLREEVRSAILEPSFGGAVAAAIDHVAAGKLWSDFERGETSWSRPWALYVVKTWGERHLATQPPVSALPAAG